ncbi:hypothetical protein QYF36_011586 [Acer negundo]|nr:hypothetical protein QYF36_011586 [Acer negundo]
MTLYLLSKRLLYNYKDLSWSPYGQYRRQMRSICVMRFLSAKRVKSFRLYRKEEKAELIKKVAVQSSPIDLNSVPKWNTFYFVHIKYSAIACGNGKGERKIVITPLLEDKAKENVELKTSSKAAFGRKYSGGESGRKFKELLREFMVLLGALDVGDLIPCFSWINLVTGFNAKVERVAKEFDKFLDEIIEEHLQGRNREGGDLSAERETRKNFLDVLLEIQRDNLAGFSIDTVSIKALMLDMFAGGTDTTYTVLEWAMTQLLRHPRVMKELQNEF